MTVSARKRARISRGVQYGVLVAVAITLILVADWGQLQRAFFDPQVAAAQFPTIITVALKNTLIYTALGFVVGLSGGVLLALMRLSSVAPYRWLA
ncbi:MAG: amino acid ABC transporter permease, partial [Mycetocola sp.]